MSQVSEKSVQATEGERSLTVSEKSIMAYPSPELLAGYENVKAGYADKLIAMAEKEQDARIKRESAKLTLADKRENTNRMGLYIGLVSVLPIFAISGYAFYLGHAVEGAAIIVGSSVVNLAGIFVARKTGLFDDKKSES